MEYSYVFKPTEGMQCRATFTFTYTQSHKWYLHIWKLSHIVWCFNTKNTTVVLFGSTLKS